MTTAGAMEAGSSASGALGALASRLGSWATWLLPFALLALLLAWETDWGRRFADQPVPDAAPAPSPVQVSLLPEYTIAGGAGARRETVERTLFNPTRRPAPPPPQETAKAKLQRGQFMLTGTAVSGTTTIAFLRETNGGRARSARPGDVLNGMTVAEVKPDRVRFTLGDESEDVVLRVATGPKTTMQPGPAPVPGQPGAAPGAAPGPVPAPGAAPAPTAPAAAATPAQSAEAQTLLERRRAARAAAAAGQPQAAETPAAAPPAVANPSVPQPASGGTFTPTPQTDPRWAEVYKRMMQRGN
jgi:hypothetical protein